MTAKPWDGTAVILHLIEAARAMKKHHPLSEEARALAGWVDELERHLVREIPDAGPVGWEPRRWRELVSGDRVEMAGVEAEVRAGVTNNWHVDPRSSEYRPQPLEHSTTAVTLFWDGQERTYQMPPDGEVETLRGPAGQAVDEANGRYSDQVRGDRVMVLSSWAGDAFLTLEAAGLAPEPEAMTPPDAS